MSESNKLQNINAIEKLLKGEHISQTKVSMGYSDIHLLEEKRKRREVGEIWEEFDKDGNVIAVWKQNDGYRTKLPTYHSAIEKAKQYMNSYPNCLDDCNTKPGPYDRLDERFKHKFGRCADCQFRIESLMKNEGTYKQWEKQQMLQNALSFFEQADKEMEIVTEQIKNGHSYINSDGRQEEWSSNPELAEKMLEEYNEYKQIVLNQLKGEENGQSDN